MKRSEENNYLTFSLIAMLFQLRYLLGRFSVNFQPLTLISCSREIELSPLFFFSLSSAFPPPSSSKLKGPSEMCDVWRGDILAGIQLIVHQSGPGCHGGFDSPYSRQMTTAGTPFNTSETTSPHHVRCIRNGNQCFLLLLLPISFVVKKKEKGCIRPRLFPCMPNRR